MVAARAAKIAVLLCASLFASAARAEETARVIGLDMILGGNDGHWIGPRSWAHPKTGRTLDVWQRTREGRNAADQLFAVRDDGSAIGRVADSRFGITACDQEGKYPLGAWKQGESRSFEYPCWYGDKVRTKLSTITIQEIDYTWDGHAHALRHEWILRDKGETRIIDRRIYIFAPRRGMVREWKVP